MGRQWQWFHTSLSLPAHGSRQWQWLHAQSIEHGIIVIVYVLVLPSFLSLVCAGVGWDDFCWSDLFIRRCSTHKYTTPTSSVPLAWWCLLPNAPTSASLCLRNCVTILELCYHLRTVYITILIFNYFLIFACIYMMDLYTALHPEEGSFESKHWL